jgi:hypothetical protein
VRTFVLPFIAGSVSNIIGIQENSLGHNFVKNRYSHDFLFCDGQLYLMPGDTVVQPLVTVHSNLSNTQFNATRDALK